MACVRKGAVFHDFTWSCLAGERYSGARCTVLWAILLCRFRHATSAYKEVAYGVPEKVLVGLAAFLCVRSRRGVVSEPVGSAAAHLEIAHLLLSAPCGLASVWFCKSAVPSYRDTASCRQVHAFQVLPHPAGCQRPACLLWIWWLTGSCTA